MLTSAFPHPAARTLANNRASANENIIIFSQTTPAFCKRVTGKERESGSKD
jgi:hypothetical protein